MPHSYEVYAVEYARRQGTRYEMAMGSSDMSSVDVAYYFWVLRGGGETVVVDLGFTPEMARKRQRPDPQDFTARLRDAGVEPDRVRHVIVTHLHWDHAGNHHLFPNARFYLQESELALWTGHFARYPILSADIEGDDIAAMVRLNLAGRVELARGCHEVLPGLRLHLVGGHTAGMQVVEVAAESGPVIVASDAVKTYGNLECNLPDPRPHEIAGVLGGYELVRRLAGQTGKILPGHEPDMGACAETVSDGVYRAG